jgi:endonuclease G
LTLCLLYSFSQSTPKDYTNVAYDRGHMAPAADFICNPDMRDATFTMANVCPQVRCQLCLAG